jgi:hypothetical protein
MITPSNRLASLVLFVAALNTSVHVNAQSASAASNADAATSAAVTTALSEARAHFKAGNLDKAFDRSITFADEGHAQALHLVGRIHRQPRYRNFDPHESARLLKLAAEKGYAPAQHDLAELMRRRLGFPRDTLLAFRWHLQAAEQRYRMSELAIADMYARGEGVAANQQQASVWRARARRPKAAASARTPANTAGSASAAKVITPTRTRTAAVSKPLEKPKAKPAARTNASAQSSAPLQSGHHIQLGAYGSEAAAVRQRGVLLKQLQRISPNVLLSIVSADRKDGRGTLHRLHTQSMDLGSARFLCGKLKKLLPESGCFIVSTTP